MQPRPHPQATRELGKPEDWDDSQGKCGALEIADIMDERGRRMQSLWKPSEEELQALLRGGVVVLEIYGAGHPPVTLYTYELDQINPN